MKIGFNNTFGSQTSATSLDLQRVDLWVVNISLPPVLGYNWADTVQFLLEKFPFPNREREMIEVKYFGQTNWQIGKDAPTGAVEIPVRYAFNTLAAQALEQWYWLVGNPLTGGVGLTSQVKAMGTMTWYTPNMQAQVAGISGTTNAGANSTSVGATSNGALSAGLAYTLEGCMIKGLKFTDGDMTGNGYVNLMFSLSIDRYYPVNISAMNTVPVLAT